MLYYVGISSKFGITFLLPLLLVGVVFGAATAALSIQLVTLLQRRVVGRFSGRVLTLYAGVQTLAQVCGLGVSSSLVARAGVTQLIAVYAVVYVLGSCLAWVVLALL
ncbi:MAG: hypothetical protein NVS4B9_39970 [Ktedonobacteraceae bacterium]